MKGKSARQLRCISPAHSPDRPAIITTGRLPSHAPSDRRAQHRLVQTATRRELRGVHTHREAAGAGIGVIAGERALAAGVEPARGIERERMGGDHGAAPEGGEHFGGQI